jgi:hypothetical protein
MQLQQSQQLIRRLNNQRDRAVALLTHPPILFKDYKDWFLMTRTILSRAFGDSYGLLRQFRLPDNLGGNSEPEAHVIVRGLEDNLTTLDT